MMHCLEVLQTPMNMLTLTAETLTCYIIFSLIESYLISMKCYRFEKHIYIHDDHLQMLFEKVLKEDSLVEQVISVTKQCEGEIRQHLRSTLSQRSPLAHEQRSH